jgi:hypothetical protein
MSTFKEYLIESIKTYEFKVKIAGDVDDKIEEDMKMFLSKFECTTVTKTMRTPITETPLDFPELKNVHVNLYDITCGYPVTSHELAIYLSEKLKINPVHLRVRTLKEQEEIENNIESYSRMGTKGEAILNKPYEKVNNQAIAGEKAKLSFIKGLGKERHRGEQYKGVNDQLLAKHAPTEKAHNMEQSQFLKSVLSSINRTE